MPTSTLSNKRADNDHPVNPVNLPAERAALGAVIEDDSLLRDVVDAGLHPSDFALSDHRSVFDAVMVLANQKKPIDYVLVAEQLGNQQTNYVLVASLIEGVIVEPDHVLHYVEIVRRKAGLRRILKLAEWISTNVAETSDPDALVEDILGKAELCRTK